jgi:protein O-GlcNAc transferase
MDQISLSVVIKKSHRYIDEKNYPAASALLSLVQENFPEQADCLHAMGVIALEMDQPNVAENLIHRAIQALAESKVKGDTGKVLALFLCNLGRAKCLQESYAEAMIAWKQSLTINDDYLIRNSYKELAEVVNKIGNDIDQRIKLFESDGHVAEAKAPIHRSKGQKSQKQSKYSNKKKPDREIIAKIDRLVNIGGIENARAVEPLCLDLLGKYPNYADVYHWMGVSKLYQRQHEEALEWVDKAIQLEPWHPFYRNTKGVILRRIGTPEAAARCFRDVLKLKPNYAEVHQNIGNICRDEGRFQEAEAWYRRALELRDDYPECINNLGILKQQKKEFAEAIHFFEKAAAMKSDYANPLLNLGVLYERERRRKDAVKCYRKALKINPFIHEVWLSLLHCQMHLCDWEGLEHGIATVRRLVNESYPGELMPFNFLSLPGPDGAEQRRCGELFVATRFAQFIRQSKEMDFQHPRQKKQKIRIGYISADFRNHAVAWSIIGVLENHDSELFEIFTFSYSTDDGSEARRRIEACTNFIDIEHLDHLSAAKLIYKKEIDVLVDLTAYTSNGRSEILALRPAPVQVNYLGFPSTMAAPFIDYLIGDPIITPPHHSEHFSETLALLPTCYFPFDNNRVINGGFSRQEEGLPEDAFIFCSFNQPYKINPIIFGIWCSVLKNVPNSILWLHAFEEDAKQRLWNYFEAEGIDKARLIFAKMKAKLEDHVGRISLADLALDTIPYNGHTTTLETLMAGVPVITSIGDTFASRVATSILSAAGLPELITRNLSEYQQTAIDLAKNSSQLNSIREKVSTIKLNTKLFDTEKFTRDLESIYIQMYENWVSGNGPKPIAVH